MYDGLYGYVDKVCGLLPDESLKEAFRKCYLNTLETTVKYDENGEVFIITGDIEAMWLRDSSVQVSHYVRLAGQDKDCKKLVSDLLRRQFRCIQADPYANAFNENANGKGHRDDETLQNDLVFERKYEIDSLIYPLWLLNRYFEHTGDTAIFDSLFFDTYKVILDTLICEQDIKNSPYYFRRARIPEDTLENNGKGGDYRFTGMVRSAFRPSDDRCQYNYLVPSNMFIVATLRELENNLSENGIQNPCRDIAALLCSDVEKGIQEFATVENEEFGRIYAFETDGLGHYNLMDDANVPSLLSLPYLGYCAKNDPLYLNTRRFVLSKANPYFYEGTAAKGIGSPHTRDGYIWHIGLIMEALTTDDRDTVERIFGYLRSTTADTNFMHEGFHKDDPFQFTRSWFAWANTLFAIFIIDKYLPLL